MPPTNATSTSTGWKKKKGPTHKLKIKPFAKPPSLPPDFYEQSSQTLIRCTEAILRKQPLYRLTSTARAPPSSPKSIDQGPLEVDVESPTTKLSPISQEPISQEELYRLVNDLCVHQYGPALYRRLMQALDEAAQEVMIRPWLERHPVPLLEENHQTTTTTAGASARIATCTNHDSNSSVENRGADAMRITRELQELHERYICYLQCVRSIFLHLDRLLVYLPAQDEVVLRSGMSGTNITSNAAATATTTTTNSSRPSLGENANPAVGASKSTTSGPAWSLWEVGLAALRRHMEQHNMMEPVLVASMVQSLLLELDNWTTDVSLMKQGIRMLLELDLYADLFLPTLEQNVSFYLQTECQRWIQNDNDGDDALMDIPAFLRLVDRRLRQCNDMALMYLQSSASSSMTLSVGLGLLDTNSSSLSSSTPTRHNRNRHGQISISKNRILTTLVDTHLLAPHVTPLVASSGNTGAIDTANANASSVTMIQTQTSQLWSPKNVYPLFDDKERIVPDIKRLYVLCQRVPGGLDALKLAFGQYSRTRGLEIVRANVNANVIATNPISAVAMAAERAVIICLLGLKEHLDQLQRLAFGNDETFAACLRSIWEEILNAPSSDSTQAEDGGGRRVAELLAKHVDLRFKNAKAILSSSSPTTASTSDSKRGFASNTATTTADANANETFQNSILFLFRHVNSKDIFEAFYKRDLAKRLLLNKSVSIDMERSFLTLLKTECGSAYTSKMEGMFKDMDLSRDVMQSYSSYLAGLNKNNNESSSMQNKKVDMEVQVLTTGYWPIYPMHSALVLPSELTFHQEQFDTYYKTKYQGRRIAWQYSLGQCIVRGNFPKMKGKPCELVISLCQTVVLMCFNTKENLNENRLTIVDIMKQTGLEDRGETERVLQSLSMGRDGTRVLIKTEYEPDGVTKLKTKMKRPVSDQDVFTFNMDFFSSQRRVRITNVQMKETAQERSKTVEAVSRDRLYLIDAAVVRILKARKSLEHRALMAQVMTQLKFPATSQDIKKRVESLIEREYMERDSTDRNRYNYLA